MLWNNECKDDESCQYEASYLMVPTLLILTFGANGPVQKYQRQRVKQNNQPVGIYCGVLRKEKHKCDDAAR
jgi:hypothetical protein